MSQKHMGQKRMSFLASQHMCRNRMPCEAVLGLNAAPAPTCAACSGSTPSASSSARRRASSAGSCCAAAMRSEGSTCAGGRGGTPPLHSLSQAGGEAPTCTAAGQPTVPPRPPALHPGSASWAACPPHMRGTPATWCTGCPAGSAPAAAHSPADCRQAGSGSLSVQVAQAGG